MQFATLLLYIALKGIAVTGDRVPVANEVRVRNQTDEQSDTSASLDVSDLVDFLSESKNPSSIGLQLDQEKSLSNDTDDLWANLARLMDSDVVYHCTLDAVPGDIPETSLPLKKRPKKLRESGRVRAKSCGQGDFRRADCDSPNGRPKKLRLDQSDTETAEEP